MKVYIWGTGKHARDVIECVVREFNEIGGFIDNNPEKQGTNFLGYTVYSYKECLEDADYIIISVINYQSVLYQIEKSAFFNRSKVICIFDNASIYVLEYEKIINKDKWRILLLERKVEKLEEVLSARIENIGYEIVDQYKKGKFQLPQIGMTKEVIYKIVHEGCSLVRFGDGEFEIMAGKERPIFQRYNEDLAARLQEVISSNDEKLLIAIANNYGSLDNYTDATADGIRNYMKSDIRKYHLSVLKSDRVYYDAYMFKCYFPYKNKEETAQRVELVKKIWDKRDVIIVEGDKTRTGVGNDLFDNVNSLQRILCPTKNAYDYYEKVFQRVCEISKDKLILTVLGPMSEVLVYDLMKAGYQAVDIGQIDMDYEWYRMGAKKRLPIEGKYVSQLAPIEVSQIHDPKYDEQIIDVILS